MVTRQLIAALTPGRVREVATQDGYHYVLKKVSIFNAPDPARRFTAEARILTCLLQQGVPVAVLLLANNGKAYATTTKALPTQASRISY